MTTRIRLARAGRKKSPFFKLVACDSRAPRDGDFIEKLGTYNPLLSDESNQRFSFNEERVKYWLGVGAVPSEKVAIFLSRAGVEAAKKYAPKIDPKKIEADKKRKEEEARKKAEEKKAASSNNAGGEEAPVAQTEEVAS